MRPRQLYETYSPGRRDARAGEAKAFLATARHLRNMTARSVECQFNLNPETAETLLAIEQQKRVANG